MTQTSYKEKITTWVSQKVTLAFCARTHEEKLPAAISALRSSGCPEKLFIGYGLRRLLPVSQGGTWCEERLSVAAAYHWCHESVKENPKCLSPLEAVSYMEGKQCMKVYAS